MDSSIRMAGLALLAGCSGLMCDEQRRKSIEAMNQGVEAAKTQSFAAAAQHLENALALDPTNHEAADNLGQVFMMQADARCRDIDRSDKSDAMKERLTQCTQIWDREVAAFLRAVKGKDDEPLHHYYLGRAYHKLGKLKEARTELERTIALDRRFFKAHFILGQIHAAEERPKEAAAAWTEACRLNPTFGKPFFYLGNLYYRWDYHDQARSVLEQGAAHALDRDDRSNIYYQLGLVHDASGKLDQAVEAYSKAVEAKADNLDAKFQLGLTLAAKGDSAKARDVLSEYLKTMGSRSGEANAFKVMVANLRLAKLAGQ